eukprot:CAMPEP_0170937732 /NCGR_PEP_ID=MMETSP0735-20130129/20756_1 /TAXON_ID=186038 /ORGANISM="Fragilariopsis kerguelensis, Strain L26-C5" /LENGTH=38 /DNA_ID= /DNA_START= /DNA_END= /DNA_ORIENTATION=
MINISTFILPVQVSAAVADDDASSFSSSIRTVSAAAVT